VITEYLKCLADSSRPFFAHYFVTTRCNLRCSYCGIWRKDYSKFEDTDLSKKVIDKIKELGVHILSFTGGEPMLRDDITDLIKYAKSLGMYTQITTNGTMPEDKYISLAKSGIDFVSVSLDSLIPSETKYDPTKVIKSIFVLKENGIKPNISCVISNSNLNLGSIRTMLDFARVNKFSIMLCPAVVKTEASEYSFRVSSDIYDKGKVNEIYDFIDRNYWNYPLMDTIPFTKMSRDYMVGKRPYLCRAGLRFIDIMPNGDFGYCQDYFTDKNILSEDFDYWWRFDREIDALKIQLACAGCVYGCYPNTDFMFTRNVFYTFLTLLKRRFI